MYANGQGVPQDYATAMGWYRKAAEQSYAAAQHNLGLIYANGQGVPQDNAAALNWFRKAAEQGDAYAQNDIGGMYSNGQGVPQDYAAAMSWYRKAADQGHAAAQYNLGVGYGRGLGVPQDNAAAASWYRKAAEQGEANAQRTLGLMYGHGVPQDHVTAPKRTIQGHVPLRMDGGTFVVPVQINGIMTLEFVIDSGAADVSLPADVVSTLMRAGSIKDTDFIGRQTYVLADGSKSHSATFVIRTLKVGNTVLENVSGSVASAQGSLLLGQSFLKRFKSWSIDNANQELVLETR
jgi:clan AA aspartic protease (TIGR02281 family)